jgi:aspartate/methionine/tyrosine aminotransferase
MWFKRMELEVWFDKYQYAIDYDIGESAVKTLAVEDVEIDLGRVLLRYGYHSGKPDLRACIAEQYPGLDQDHIIVTTGASEANFAVVAALVKPGDHVVIEHPNYPSLYEVPRSLGCDVSLLTLTYENRFKPDLDELKSKITPATKLVSLTHPNNPTGSIISEKELREVIDVVESYETFLLFDETYRHMAYGENLLPPAASLSDRVVSITGMSKCYGLPGTRTGWLATTNQSILDEVVAIREQLSISNNTLGEEIALSVLKRKDTFLDSARKRIENNREIVAAWIEKHESFEWVYPEAGVVCFPRIKDHVEVDPDKLYRHLAEEYKTFIVPGRCFEMDSRHFRIGFGADAEEIRVGLSNLDKALNDFVSKEV